jgi:hypothetical protein
VNLTVSGFHRFHLAYRAERRAKHGADLLVQQPRVGEDDIVGVEWLAVVELHVRAKVENPGLQILTGFPVRRKIGHHLQLAVLGGQAAEHAISIVVVEATDPHLGRIECGDGGRIGDADRAALGCTC